MKHRSLNKTVLIMAILLLLSCNVSPDHLSQFKGHPSVYLLVPNAQVPSGYVWSMDWSTPSTLTLLTVEITEGRWPIYLSDASTGRIFPVLRNGKELWSRSAKVSPDGKYLAYRIMVEDLGTYIATLDKQSDTSFGLKDEHLIINTANIHSLDWSYDGKKLAMLAKLEDGVALYVYDPSNKNIQESFVYKEENIESVDDLSWSPDGNQLAFSLRYAIHKINTYHFQADVFVYHIEENRLMRLTSTPKINEEHPAWFPNDNVLTYMSTRDEDAESTDSRLVFSTKDGKCTKAIPGLEGIETPSWSPDGTQIAFKSTDGVEIMDVAKVIPPEYLTPSGLCK